MTRALLRLLAVTVGAVGAVVLWTLLASSSASADVLPASQTPPAAAPAPAPVACPSVQVLAIPGTGETTANADPAQARGLLAHVTDPLVGSLRGARVFYVPYVASGAPGTYGDSKAQAVATTNAEIARTAGSCPATSFVLTGYSQGAAAAGDVAAAIGNGRGPVPANRVAAVGLVADPNRGAGDTGLSPAPVKGEGMAGDRPQGFGVLATRVVSLCDPADLYCATPAASQATQDVARALSAPSGSPAGLLNELGATGGDPLKVIGVLQRHGVHDVPSLVRAVTAALPPGTVAQLGRLLADFNPTAVATQLHAYQAFLASGAHTDYASAPGGGQPAPTALLSQWMGQQILR